jgi:DeoR/GlpR family transcriptional regulator of sugar metabolism
MLTEERRRAILSRLERDGKVVAADLVDALGVSEDTVRRDLRELAAQGLAQRVHGGALPPPAPARLAPSFRARRAIDPAGKALIAAAGVALARPGDVILLGGGTTLLEFARRLPDDLDATVVTTGPDIAAALADHRALEVVQVGGRVHPDARTVVGAEAVAAVREVRADLCVLGVCSLHPQAGLTALHREEAQVERAMLEGAVRVATLTGAEKLGSAGPFPVAPVEAITTLVTDRDAPPALLAPYEALGIEVLRAA